MLPYPIRLFSLSLFIGIKVPEELACDLSLAELYDFHANTTGRKPYQIQPLYTFVAKETTSLKPIFTFRSAWHKLTHGYPVLWIMAAALRGYLLLTLIIYGHRI